MKDASKINPALIEEIAALKHRIKELEQSKSEHRQLEEELRESEARFRHLLQNAQSVSVQGYGPDGTTQYWNKASEKLYGYSAQEAIGHNLVDLIIPPEMRGDVEQAIRQMVETGEPIPGSELSLLRKDGSRVSVFSSHTIIQIPGRPPELFCIDTDLTERKEAEGFLQDIIAKNPMSIQILNKEGLTLEVNTAYKLLFGSVPPEGYSIFNDLQLLQQGMGKLFDQLRNGAVVRFPDTYFNAHDSIPEFPDVPAWIRTIGFPLNDSNGKPERFVFMHEDITDRKGAETALRESEERYRTAIEASHDGIAIVQNDVHVYVNQAFLKMFRYNALDEIIGRDNYCAIHPDDYERVVGYIQARRKREYAPTKYEFKGIRKDGTPIDVEVSVNTITYKGEEAILTYLKDNTDRKQAEKALRENELFLEETQRIARLGGWKANPHTDYLEWTQGVYDIVEAPNDYKPGLSEGLRVFAPEYIPIIQDELAKCLFTGKSFKVECEALTLNGKKLWTEVRGLMPILEGARSYVMGTLQDITDHKQAEESLKESEEKFRLLYEKSVDPILMLDGDRFVDCNEAAVKIMHCTGKDQLIGTKPSDISPDRQPDGRLSSEKADEVIGVALKEGSNIFEWKHRTVDGEEFWADVSLTVMAIQGRRIMYVVWRDITSRKNAEETITSERSKLKTLSGNAPFGMALISKEGHFTYINAKFTELFGFDLTDIPDGRTWFKKAYPDTEYRHMVISTWIEDLRDAKPGERIPRVFTVNSKDGTERIVRFIPSVLVSGDYLMTCEDITELRHLENQLRQAQKMEAIGTLAGGVAHDFNNILTVLMGYASLIRMKMDISDPLRPYLDEVFSASEKAVDLTKSLLTFSRQQSVTLVPLDINNTVKAAENLLRRLLTEDIALHTSLADDDMVVMADRSQMDQILFNLVTNARDAMARGGTLTIETSIANIDTAFMKTHGLREPGEYVQINISDTGMGMSEITRSKIFDPFFTTKEVGKGTGLGLATVYGIVKLNKGYITVESKINKGTTFHIYLPRVRVKVDETESAITPPTGGKETILIAEDNEGVRCYMREVLQEYGYTVREAIDGEDAVERFKEHRGIDLIIIDSVMPKKNGRETYEEIHKTDPQIKVIFTSGYTKDIVLDKGIEDEKFDFIAKPLSINKLLLKIREVLDRE